MGEAEIISDLNKDPLSVPLLVVLVPIFFTCICTRMQDTLRYLLGMLLPVPRNVITGYW